jgi:hypothetical protein
LSRRAYRRCDDIGGPKVAEMGIMEAVTGGHAVWFVIELLAIVISFFAIAQSISKAGFSSRWPAGHGPGRTAVAGPLPAGRTDLVFRATTTVSTASLMALAADVSIEVSPVVQRSVIYCSGCAKVRAVDAQAQADHHHGSPERIVAYCMNCGTGVEEGAQDCASCVTPTTQVSARRR